MNNSYQTCDKERHIFCKNCPNISSNIQFASRIDFNKITSIVADVIDEFNRATHKHPPFNSRHEAYAILIEEVDELWTEVKKNHSKNPEAKITQRKEAIQVAAMAFRFIYDCDETQENW